MLRQTNQTDEPQQSSTTSSGLFSFFSYRPALPDVSNWINYFPKFNLMPDGFKLNGFPIFVPEALKKSFALAISLYQLTLVEAQKYNSIYFANSANTTNYKIDVIEEHVFTHWKKIAEKSLEECSAIGSEAITDAVYTLLKTITVSTDNGGGGGGDVKRSDSDGYDVLKFYREAGNPPDGKFEHCIEKEMASNPINTEMQIALVVIAGVIGLSVTSYLVYQYCCKRNANTTANLEEKPLLESEVKTSKCSWLPSPFRRY